MSDLSWILIFVVVLPVLAGLSEWRKRAREERRWQEMTGQLDRVAREEVARITKEVHGVG
tara:strand:- start:3192 stop:3371 length:180 start_codon:yes stop_codon:yes gene_type:complete